MEFSRDDIKLVKAFVQRSRSDLRSAITLLNADSYADAAYHAQQCAEKIVKSLLILNNQFVRTHIVSGIFATYVSTLKNDLRKDLQKIVPMLIELERHWVLPRYPEPAGEEIWNPLEEYTKEDAELAVTKAKIILEKLSQFIEKNYDIKLKVEREK